jgi:hypothetical protein
MSLTLQTAVESIASLKSSGDPAGELNMACERLYSFGKYKGFTKTLFLKAYEDGRITLPQDYETLLGARLRGVPQRLHDPWFQFVPSGNGVNPAEPGIVSLDLGDGHVCYRGFTGATDLRIASEAADAAKTFSIQVRPTSDEGIMAGLDGLDSEPLGDFNVSLGLGAVDSVVSFTKEATTSLVALEAQLDGVWVEVARFMPRDTEICLRKYSLPIAQEGDVALVYCKRRFRPISKTNDIVPIDSIYILRLALEAMGYELTGELDKASGFWGMARKALDDSLSEHRSSSGATVPIYCRAAAGAGLRAIR